MTQRATGTSPLVRPVLTALAFAVVALAIFQWGELVYVRGGGHAVCTINQTLNCEAVWESAAARRVHQVLGVPVAGLGLIWGAGAAIVLVALGIRERRQAPVAPLRIAVRVFAWVGLWAVVAFAAVSFHLRNLCLTCLGTYLLVLAFFAFALRLPTLPLSDERERVHAFLWMLLPPLGVYLVALFPGILTLRTSDKGLANWRAGEGQQAAAPEGLEQFMSALSDVQRQQVSDMLALYRQTPEGKSQSPRVLWGSPNAPVRLVEFTDIRCSHCGALVGEMSQMEKTAPPDSFSVDPRSFPLDSECNPLISGTDGTHIRCLGAKAQICLENAPDFWKLRAQLFAEQTDLTPARILDIASSGSVSRSQLEQCVASPETAAKLQEDIDYAAQFRPTGTPIVIMNGRQVMPFPNFIFAMILAGGRVDAPAFQTLPPPRSPGD